MLAFLISSFFLFQVIYGQPVDSISKGPLKSSQLQSSNNGDLVYTYSIFAFTNKTKPTYVQSNTQPIPTTYHGPAYSDVSHLLGELSTTTWVAGTIGYS